MNFEKYIAELMDEVAACYPPGRIAAAQARWTDFWAHRPAKDRLPYVIDRLPGVSDFTRRRNWPEMPAAYTPVQRDLVSQLRGIIERSAWGDDYIPALMPEPIQAAIPAYFGALEERIKGSVRVKPIIGDPSDVYKLAEIGFPPDSYGSRVLAHMRYLREVTGGRITIVEADSQGPFSVATHVWGMQEYLEATLADPVEAEFFLKRTTAAVLEFFRLMREASDGQWSAWHIFTAPWMPPDAGIVSMSEDMLSVVSPNVVGKYIVPALEAIGEEFGKVFVHTCGNVNHTVRVAAEAKSLAGINVSSSETDIRVLAELMGDRFIYLIHHALVHDSKLETLDVYGQARLFRETFAGSGLTAAAMLMPVVGTYEVAQDAERIRDMFVL